MATNKTTKSNLTAKAPAEKAVQTTLKVETEVKKPAAEVKTVAPVVKEEVKPVEEKTAPAAEKKPEAKKPGRKAAAKKTTRKAVKNADVEVKPDVYVQFAGMEYSEKEIMDKVIAAWEAEGKKASAIKRVKLYVKPEDSKAYYVINEKLKNGSTGAVDL